MVSEIRMELYRIRLKVHELARKCGMNEDRLSKLMLGRMKDVREQEILAIAKALDWTPERVREDVERMARARREEIARAA